VYGVRLVGRKFGPETGTSPSASASAGFGTVPVPVSSIVDAVVAGAAPADLQTAEN
jgi:hypothetical protein